jgi:hypothetical protein
MSILTNPTTHVDVLQFGMAFFEKVAADMTPANNLGGRFVISEQRGKPWGLLTVPNALMHGVFQAMAEPGIELPPSDSGKPEAHITVVRPEEIMAVGGAEKFKADRGKQFNYSIGRLVSLTPQGWDEMSKAWMLRVHSTDLQALRKSYGLSAKPKNDKFDFHITVAVRRKNVLQRGEISKVQTED